MWSSKNKTEIGARTPDGNPGAMEEEIKVILVGDTQSGKTSLVHRFISDEFREAYTPTGFEKYGCTCPVSDYNVNYSVWDTSGTVAYDTVRPLAYQDGRVFLLCFNIGDPDSLQNAATKWIREIRQHGSPSAPIILCGCKSDLRQDVETVTILNKMQTHPVTCEEGVSMARALGAATYVETSSRLAAGAVKDAFHVAALAALGKLNKINHNKQQKQVGRSKSKRDLKAELKGRAKSCCVM